MRCARGCSSSARCRRSQPVRARGRRTGSARGTAGARSRLAHPPRCPEQSRPRPQSRSLRRRQPPAAPVGTSPQKLWDVAYADYTLGQWDLAIAGFEAVIMYFPRAERAADAQVHIGTLVSAGRQERQGGRSVRHGDRELSGIAGVARRVLQEGTGAQEPEAARCRARPRSSTS